MLLGGVPVRIKLHDVCQLLEHVGYSLMDHLFVSRRRVKLGHSAGDVYGILFAVGGAIEGWVGHFTPQGALYGSSSLGAAVTPSGQNEE